MELKTLKDMRRAWFESDEDINSVCGNMTINWITDGRKLLDEEQLKQEAIKWVKCLLKITKTKIIKMPEIKLTKKGIDVRHGHFDGKCMDANYQFTNEFFSALILCKMYDLTEEDLKGGKRKWK